MSQSMEDGFFDGLGALGPAILRSLSGFEGVARRLHPPELPGLRAGLRPAVAPLQQAKERFAGQRAPDGLDGLQRELLDAATTTLEALELFCSEGDPTTAVPRVLGAMRANCRAQEALFPLRAALPPVSRYFVEAPYASDLEALEPAPGTEHPVGLMRGKAQADGRGGFSLYVPESYDGRAPWPLVVALHGGSGEGRDFLWTWLREARGRRFLLLSPTSLGPTWSLMGPDRDAGALAAMVRSVKSRWNVDSERVLLTGLSDGATYTLLGGLQQDMPFTAFAPVSGVLHPMNFANGNLERARDKRIYLVHGALDWMFPIDLARVAHDELRKAGADIVFREIPNLSHTYPREENDRILSWFDPSLALPDAEGS